MALLIFRVLACTPDVSPLTLSQGRQRVLELMVERLSDILYADAEPSELADPKEHGRLMPQDTELELSAEAVVAEAPQVPDVNVYVTTAAIGFKVRGSEDGTVVSEVSDDALRAQGVALGMRIKCIGTMDTSALPHDIVLDALRIPDRPLGITFFPLDVESATELAPPGMRETLQASGGQLGLLSMCGGINTRLDGALKKRQEVQTILILLLRCSESLAVCGMLSTTAASVIHDCLKNDNPGTQVLAMRLVRAVVNSNLEAHELEFDWNKLVADTLSMVGDAELCTCTIGKGSTAGGKLASAAEASALLRTLLFAPETCATVTTALKAALTNTLSPYQFANWHQMAPEEGRLEKTPLKLQIQFLGALATLGGTRHWVHDLSTVTLQNGSIAMVAHADHNSATVLYMNKSEAELHVISESEIVRTHTDAISLSSLTEATLSCLASMLLDVARHYLPVDVADSRDDSALLILRTQTLTGSCLKNLLDCPSLGSVIDSGELLGLVAEVSERPAADRIFPDKDAALLRSALGLVEAEMLTTMDCPTSEPDPVLEPLVVEVEATSSNQSNAKNVLDGDTNTYWESNGRRCPHFVLFRLSRAEMLQGMQMYIRSGDDSYSPKEVHSHTNY